MYLWETGALIKQAEEVEAAMEEVIHAEQQNFRRRYNLLLTLHLAPC